MELSWNDITEEQLKHLYYDEGLSDRQIADLFGISKSKVIYRRNKFGISLTNKIYEKFIEQNVAMFKELSFDSKERLLKQDNIESIAKAITHFVFRNGPIEDMHSKNQFSEDDMKTLNKYMVNRIAGLLTAIADGRWLELEQLYNFYKLFGTDWDKVEPDVEEINFVLKHAITGLFKKER